MVQIIQENRKPTFSERLNQGIGQGLETGSRLVQEHANKKEINNLLGPGHENLPPEFQQMAYQAKLNKQQKLDQVEYDLKNAQKLSDINKSFREPIELRGEGQKEPSRKSIGVNGKPEQNISTERLPEKSPQEIEQEAALKGETMRKAGMPVSDEDVAADLDMKNNRNIAHNNNLDIKEQNKRQKQRDYGTQAVEKIVQLLPDASQAVRNSFQSKGEELATSGKSEAEISTQLGKEATELKNKIATIERSVGPKRLANGVYRDIMGTSRESQKQQDDMKIKLKPLLDLGFYDEARSLLSNLGYEPEERETLVSNLGETAKKELAALPKFSTEKLGFFERGRKGASEENRYGMNNPEYSKENLEKINKSVLDVMEKDPATNLILLRKGYEDKGVDWDTFKNALNDAIVSGNIKLSPDQFNALEILDQPPLDLLDKMLHKLGFAGK